MFSHNEKTNQHAICIFLNQDHVDYLNEQPSSLSKREVRERIA